MSCSSLEGHVQRFLNIKHNPSTRGWYEKYLRPMVAHLGGERPLDSVGRAEAEEYWQAILGRDSCWASHPYRPTQSRKLSPTTLTNHLRAARTFWNEMVRQRLVEFNPFDHLSAPKDTRPMEMKAIAPEDLRAIWKAARASSKRDFALVTVMATSGVRASELVSMNLQQLNLTTGEAWVLGKRGWRKIFLGEASLEAITDYLESERCEADGPALWIGRYGEPMTADGVRRMIYRMARAAKVTGRHNLHAFRHRAAQAWLDDGINAEIVMRALEHADVTVTLSIYGNQDDKRVKKAICQAEMLPFRISGLDSLKLGDINIGLDR